MSERDLVHHYKVLKQFLDISDDVNTRSKSNSSRAARAREKLLKLSAAQFKELSTDVYDELRRRIDESRGEPDYLLPKSSFHPKRNQARQKLSSLPQTRFKDLVSDISYEIERRNLHGESAPEYHETASNIPDNVSSRSRSIVESQRSPVREKSFKNDPNESGSSDLQNIGIQSKTVVPTKANLTWSSDEEDGEESKKSAKDRYNEAEARKSEIRETEAKARESRQAETREAEAKEALDLSTKKDDKIAELQTLVSSLELQQRDLQEKHKLLQDDYEYSMSQNKTLSQEVEQLSEQKRDWTSSKDLQHLQSVEAENEAEKLKSSNAALRLEIQALKNGQQRNTKMSRDLNSITNSDSTTSIPNVDYKQDIKRDMETFLEKLSTMESPPSKQGSSYAELRSEISKWQKKYEEARSNTLSSEISKSILGNDELQSFMAPHGLISMKLVGDFQALVETFLIYLNGTSFDSDLLFEKISKISILANEIASQGDNQHINSNEHSVCLRESVSYAITATRYFAIYSSILPKIVVERAVGEVSFSLCDLIAFSKLNSSSLNSRTVQPMMDVPVANQHVKDDFGARPLRMANKLRVIQSHTKSQEELLSFDQTDNNSPFQSTGPEEKNIAENDPTPKLVVTKKTNPEGVAGGFLRKFSPFGSRNVSTPITPKPVEVQPIQPAINRVRFGGDESEAVPERKLSLKQLEIVDDETPKKIELQIGNSITPTANAASDSLTQDAPTHATSGNVELKKVNEENLYEKSPKGKGISALASKFERSPEKPIGQHASPTSTNKTGVKNLANRLNSPTEILPQNQSPTRAEKTKKGSIFDKVRQFESPEQKNIPSTHILGKSPSNQLIHSRKTSLGLDLEPEFTNHSVIRHDIDRPVERLSEPFAAVAEPSQTMSREVSNENNSVALNERNKSNALSATAAIAATAATAAAVTSLDSTKSKGLFSSIRDKLTQDHQHTNEETGISEEGVSDSDKREISTDNALTSTVETTPSKDDEDESESNISPVKAGKDFFETVKQKLTTGSLSEHNVPYSSASDVTIQADNADDRNAHFGNENSEPAKEPEQDTKPKQNIKSAVITENTNGPIRKESLNVQTPLQISKKVNYQSDTKTKNVEPEQQEDDDYESESESESESEEESEARQRQEYRKSMAAATFNVNLFDIDDPDNTLTQVLLYLEHQTVQVISTIQSLLSAIKKPNATRGDLRENSKAILVVISQMTEATNTSMNQTRNAQLKEHGSWVVRSLEDCNHRLNILCKPNSDKSDEDFADKNFKQRLAGISFDIAKCTKELVKTVEEASLKEDIANLDARLSHGDDLN